VSVTTPAASTAPPVSAAPGLRHLFDLTDPRLDVDIAFAALAERYDRYLHYYLGYPVAHDLLFPRAQRLLAGRMLNNISTERRPAPGHQHAMEPESAVLDWLGRLVGVPADQRWGHITTGGTSGNRTGIRRARALYPEAVLLHSDAAHYSVSGAARDLRMEALRVPAHPNGAMNLHRLDDTISRLKARRFPGDPAVIVVATLGTTITEASDDLAGIADVLDSNNIRRRYVHVDAALAGIPLALDGCISLDYADSISVSAYKFLAVPAACGIVLGRTTEHHDDAVIPYTGTLDATETGVRSGLHAALTFEAIAALGDAGHRARAHASRELADHTIAALREIGVEATRNRSAYFTVRLPSPPEPVLAKWTLGANGGGSHRLVLVPGKTRAQVDEFVDDLKACLTPAGTPKQRTGGRGTDRRNIFAEFAGEPQR
jgi:histidine decarboxylase